MLFNVPQNIDVEDKVAGPLTAKQLLWMIALSAVLFIMWTFIPSKAMFFVAAIPTVMIFIALAFMRPYGQPMINFIFAGIRFLFGSKVYVWKRTPQKMQVSVKKAEDNHKTTSQAEGYEERRQNALKNLKSIAKIIDSRGTESDGNAASYLKKPDIKK